MKKIIFVFVLLSILQSCTKKEQYWEIGSFTIGLFGDNFVPAYTDTIVSKNLYLQLNFQPVYSMNMQPEISFFNKAYAYDPMEPDYSLKHSISKIIVTSISDFNGIKAGDDISSKLVYCGQANMGSYCENISLENFIYTYLVQESTVMYEATLKFIEKPINPKQQFTITFVDSQGKKTVSMSELIYWK